MRLALLFGVPWLVTFGVTAILLLVESSLAKKREAAAAMQNADDVAVPFKAPGVWLYLGLSLLFGFLVIPAFFFMSRRGFLGLFIGLGAMVVPVVVAGLAGVGGKYVIARSERATYLEACESEERTRSISSSTCKAIAESLDTGTYCVNKAVDASSCGPGTMAISVAPNPEQATRIYVRACLQGFNYDACKTLESRPGISESVRAKAVAKHAEICSQPYNATMCD